MERKLICKVDFIEVEAVQGTERTVGRGSPAPYRHKSMKDPYGNPFCGKVALEPEDVEFDDSDPSTEAEV